METKTTNPKAVMDRYLTGTLSYYYNPFSRTEVSPKIPDGKMETSIGVQQLISSEYVVTNPEPTVLLNGYVTTYIFLMPGIGSPLQIWDPRKPANVAATDVLTPILRLQPTNTDWFEWTPAAKTVEKSPATWRMVSQGLQVWPINSTTATSGTYESFSVPMPSSDMNADVASPQLTPTLIAYYENNIQRLRDSKTYSSGTVSQLTHFQFRQLPNDPEHSPINISTSYASPATFLDEPASKVNFLEDVLDHSFHMRVIRLRTPVDSRFLINTVTNFEFQYRLNSPIAGFQTYNDRHVNMAEQANQVAQGEGSTEGKQLVTPTNTPNQQGTKRGADNLPRDFFLSNKSRQLKYGEKANT